ncbi:MAG: sensor histidine kinase [Nitrospirales bacterium]
MLLVGGGKGGTALLDLLVHLRDVQVIGLVDKNPMAPAMLRAADMQVPTAQHVLDLFGAPPPHLIIDVTGDPSMGAFLQTHASRQSEILGGVAAKLFWLLVQHEARLQSHLFRTEQLASVGTFAAGIAHDINNPLHVIMGLAEQLQEEQDPSRVREHARDITQAVQRIRALTLDMTLYATRTTPQQLTAVDLTATLEEALNIARYATAFQDVSVVKDYAAKPTVRGTQEELLHVFVNLLINAIHAMNDGGTLTLRIGQHDTHAEVAISDTGCGIPKDSLPKIFEPFFTTKAPGKGTGLGLHNVRTVVEKFHGRITVDSQVGRGTTFRLTFPLAVESPAGS